MGGPLVGGWIISRNGYGGKLLVDGPIATPWFLRPHVEPCGWVEIMLFMCSFGNSVYVSECAEGLKVGFAGTVAFVDIVV